MHERAGAHNLPGSPETGSDEDVEQLIEQAWRLRLLDPLRSLRVSEAAVTLARQAAPGVLMRALLGRGAAHCRLFHHADADADLAGARAICEQHGDDLTLALIEKEIGIVRVYQGQTARGYEHYLAALDIARRHDNLQILGACHNNIGTIYIRIGDFAAALEEQMTALSIFQQSGDRVGEANVQMNIGLSFGRSGRPADGVSAFEHAIAISREIRSMDVLAHALHHLAATYRQLGNFEASHRFNAEALRVAEQYLQNIEGRVLREIAHAYLDDPAAEHRTVVLDTLQGSLNSCRAHGDHEGEVQTLNLLGRALTELHEPDAALGHLLMALDLADQGQYHNHHAEALGLLAALHEHATRPAEALRYLREQIALEKRRVTEQAEQRTELLMVRYRTEQAVHAAQLAAKEAELQRLRNDELAGALRALEQADREREALLRQLEHQAQHDQLTGLANRALFTLRVQQAIGHAAERQHGAAVLYLDLDGFKHVNDTLGHTAGDRLLQVIAARLQSCVTPGDTVARMGGDEFTVVLAETHGAARAELVAQRLLRVVRQPVQLGEHTVFVTGSAGLAVYPADGVNADTLQQHADIAMYVAKHAGKNAWRRFDPHMTSGSLENLDLSAQLRTALGAGQLDVHYQHIHEPGGAVMASEALLRWNHPRLGLLPTARFLQLVEESGLMAEVGSWVLTRGCQDARSWHADLPVSVNISARQWTADLPAVIQGALAHTALPAARLLLEVNEDALVQDVSLSVRLLHELRGQGVRVLMDHFGQGQSSLAHLPELPLYGVKLDVSVVRAARTPGGQLVARALVELARTLGLRAYAVGAEDEADVRTLIALGVTGAQGHAFEHP